MPNSRPSPAANDSISGSYRSRAASAVMTGRLFDLAARLNSRTTRNRPNKPMRSDSTCESYQASSLAERPDMPHCARECLAVLDSCPADQSVTGTQL